jgi:hypothetical protein
VKILKLGMVICGALGIAGLIMRGIGLLMEVDKAATVVVLIAFALPVAMALIGLVKPPMQSWQAGVALAGFALAAWKLEIWRLIKELPEVPTEYQLMAIGAALGVILTVIAVLKPEEVRPIS